MKNGRFLDDNFKQKFKNEFKFIIEYVKKNKDVFLGIRNNSINLFVNGGCFFELYKKGNDYIGSFNINGYHNYLKKYSDKKDLSEQLDKIVDKQLNDENINIWNEILPELKKVVEKYMFNHKVGVIENCSSREKILQQKIALSFNNINNNYFNYDIEYNVEGFSDYYYFEENGKPNNLEQPHTIGRIDNMVVSIKNNKAYFHLMEVKENTDAITATKKNSKNIISFGNGIIGHVNLYMQIIDCLKKDKIYTSSYNGLSFNFREYLLNDLKNMLSFYVENELVGNHDFSNLSLEDINNLKYGDAELVFYFGGYKKNSKKITNHLGTSGNQVDSVLNLVNRNLNDYKLLYKYITSDQIYDFKYHIDYKNYNNPNSLKDDIDISKYSTVNINKINNLVEFKVHNE